MIGSTRRTSITGPKAKVLTAPEKGVVVIPHKVLNISRAGTLDKCWGGQSTRGPPCWRWKQGNIITYWKLL